MRHAPAVRSVLVLSVFSFGALAACGGGGGGTSATTMTPLPTVFKTIPPVDETIVEDTVVNSIPAEQVYKVQNGDVLFSIASSFGVTAQEIADWNEWTDGINHLIFAGMDIKIPPGGTPQSQTTDPPVTGDTIIAGNVETTTTLAAGAPGTYTVEDGDYLSGIASKFNTTVDAIVAANGWSDGANHVIYAGLEIKLPTSLTPEPVRAWKIACFPRCVAPRDPSLWLR